jgi:hypothetical protein
MNSKPVKELTDITDKTGSLFVPPQGRPAIPDAFHQLKGGQVSVFHPQRLTHLDTPDRQVGANHLWSGSATPEFFTCREATD